MVEKVISHVKFEIEQIDRLFEDYVDLLERTQKKEPDIVEVTAVASVMHSFYNGLENIFLSIAKGIDQNVPTGDMWHRNLLTRMTETTSSRKQVLTVDMSQKLKFFIDKLIAEGIYISEHLYINALMLANEK